MNTRLWQPRAPALGLLATGILLAAGAEGLFLEAGLVVLVADSLPPMGGGPVAG